jgi:4a-hydroxytetrahydrobiopterin dehydratase
VISGTRHSRFRSDPTATTELIQPRDFHEADGVEDWRVVGEGACAYFRTGSFAAGARLVQAIGALPELEAYHPDVDLRYGGVTVRLITIRPGYYGLSLRDIELARKISAVARELGIPADPSVLQNIQVSIDSLVGAEVLPFWRAVLGYQERGDDPGDLIDPRARGPLVYSQRISASHPRRSQIHLDVWVAHDQAEARIAAALAAGGRLVTDAHAPSWSTLEDTQGNRVCVCTWRRRD